MEFEEKEKFEGTYKDGTSVRFNRVYAGHRFTDEECEALLNGENVEIRGLTSAKGSTYGVVGCLSEQEYNGHTFWGYERTGFIHDIPSKICGHRFDEAELDALKEGRMVLVKDFVSKKSGKPFGAKIHWDEDTKRIAFDEFYKGEKKPVEDEPVIDLDNVDPSDIDLEEELPF